MKPNFENNEMLPIKKSNIDQGTKQFSPESFDINKKKLEQVANYDLNKPDEGWIPLQGYVTSYTPEQMEQAVTQNEMYNSFLAKYPGINEEKLKKVFAGNQKELLDWMSKSGTSSMTELDVKKLDKFAKKFGAEVYSMVKDTIIYTSGTFKAADNDLDKYDKVQQKSIDNEKRRYAVFVENFSDDFVKGLSGYGVVDNNVYEKYTTYKAKQQGGYSQQND